MDLEGKTNLILYRGKGTKLLTYKFLSSV